MTDHDKEWRAEMVEGTRLAALAHALKTLPWPQDTVPFVRLYSPENAPQFLDVTCMTKATPATTVTFANELFKCTYGEFPADNPERAAHELAEAMLATPPPRHSTFRVT